MSCIDVTDLIGCKYTQHGRTKEQGFDCYGLVIEIYKRIGISLPDPFYEFTDDSKIKLYSSLVQIIPCHKIDKPEYLCIIVFTVKGNPTHVGVYLGNNMFIHCSEGGVKIEPLHRWERRIEGYYKVKS